ncbi:hypothetical protein KJ359_007413 [Pestalotiopsis sp. 9143b]|nr:hypothetical protein KJ359_007413 [Pestalotiopsis sp. 9143b]
MTSSPQTPRHSRQSSFAGSPTASRRRTSKSSFQDLMAPSPNMNDQDISTFSAANFDGGDNGLGNLADELADALSGDEDDDGYYEEGEGEQLSDGALESPKDRAEEIRDSGVDVEEHKQLPARNKKLELSPPPNPKSHRRQGSAYDGSEYGSESDLETAGMPPSLVARMDAVESLARRGTDGGPADKVFHRVTEGLRDLGSQASVEGSTTRLITAHSALATHLAHQTRQLHNLTFPLLSPLVMPPDADTIDELLPLLVSLSDDMPRPATAAYNSLAALQTLTSDLVQTLNYLSDTLHMSRQTTTTATRRLKSAKDMVAEMKREEELREEGERWLTKGNWGERLEKRECADVCRDVVSGFEEMCNDWRAKLVAQAEATA